jgi:hypothetical protein
MAESNLPVMPAHVLIDALKGALEKGTVYSDKASCEALLRQLQAAPNDVKHDEVQAPSPPDNLTLFNICLETGNRPVIEKLCKYADERGVGMPVLTELLFDYLVNVGVLYGGEMKKMVPERPDQFFLLFKLVKNHMELYAFVDHWIETLQ